MATKSGRMHYTCKVKTYKADGSIIFVNDNFKFTAKDGTEHLEKMQRSYASHQIIFEYTDLKNLDSDI